MKELNVGARIKERRKELGLSQEELALKAGYHDRSIIAKFESGRSVPLNKLPDIAIALNTTPAFLEGTVISNLEALGITVADTPNGILLTDFMTSCTAKYSKEQWDQLQALEDFRTIFKDLHVQMEESSDAKNKTPAPKSEDKRSAIQFIFDQLTPANQSKLLELAGLYLDQQRKTEETK